MFGRAKILISFLQLQEGRNRNFKNEAIFYLIGSIFWPPLGLRWHTPFKLDAHETTLDFGPERGTYWSSSFKRPPASSRTIQPWMIFDEVSFRSFDRRFSLILIWFAVEVLDSVGALSDGNPIRMRHDVTVTEMIERWYVVLIPMTSIHIHIFS